MPAVIYMWSGTYVDVEDKDAVLLCRATGNPAPRISWYTGDNQLITSDYHFEVYFISSFFRRDILTNIFYNRYFLLAI